MAEGTVTSGAAPVNLGQSSGGNVGASLEDQLGKIEVVENNNFDIDMNDEEGPKPFSEDQERPDNYDPYSIDDDVKKPAQENSEVKTPEQPVVNEWQQKYEQQANDFEKLRSFLNRPEVLQALQPVLNPNTPPPAPEFDPSQEFNYGEEDLLDPDSFAKATSTKVTNLYQRMVSKIEELNNKIQNIQQEYKPVVDKQNENNYNTTIENVITKYAGQDPAAQAEVRKFFTPGTPEYSQYVSVLQKHPTLSLEEAFVFVRPQAIQKVVDQKVQATVDNRRSASVPVGRPTTPTVSLRTQKPTVRDAISLAIEKHGIK